ncbi:MAG: hypothetical protein QOI02_1202 [Actinomycetota bacterium]|nr:hypothetical protein [Actinomycetota bacterium]
MTTTVSPTSFRLKIAASRGAAGAVSAQVIQAAGSLALQVLTARLLGVAGLGRFAVLFGVIVLVTAVTSGFVGDSLTVLDRRNRSLRSGLEAWALILATGAGLLAFGAAWISGFATAAESALFGLAASAFLLEDLIRRLLMATFQFWRIVIVDLSAALTTIALMVGLALARSLSLAAVLGCLALGQCVGLAVGMRIVSRSERYLVPLRLGGMRKVASFGAWRAAQQALRPGVLTFTRVAVVVAAGVVATGGLEAARIYAAPTMLFIGGISSFLFAWFARNELKPLGVLRLRADQGVLALLGLTLLITIIGLIAVPVLGPMLVGVPLNPVALAGWFAFAATIAAVTPYGTLASVRGRQAAVFLIRLCDSVAAALGVAALLWLGGAPVFAPLILAGASLAGGLVIRFVVLSTGYRRQLVPHPASPVKGDISRVRIS